MFLVAGLLALSALGHVMGSRFARRARGAGSRLPALPGYFGWYVALWTALPSLLLLLLWTATQDWAVRQILIATLPTDLAALPPDRLSLELTTARNIAYGLVPREGAAPALLAAAGEYLRLRGLASLALWGVALAAAAGGLSFALAQLSTRLRARHAVERVVMILLIACSVVPMNLREGSLSLGATRAETVVRVVLPAALPGIVAAVILAFSRALGETMIVVMAAGLAANITANPLDAVTTVTVHIAMLLVGDQEFDSAKTLSAFALGLVLFLATLTLNVIALQFARRYRERYE